MTTANPRRVRSLSRTAGRRRRPPSNGVQDVERAKRRAIAVHDAVRLLGLEPASDPESGYDARGPEHRYRIAGCSPADPLLAPGTFPPGKWDRGLLVTMTAEMEPLTIDELTVEAVRATRIVIRLRAAGRRLWRRE